MGADQKIMTVPEAYSKLDLLQPQYSDYENDFEKQLFMAINLIRHDPKIYGSEAVKLAMYHPLAKKLKKDDLQQYLKKCEKLPIVTFDTDAIQATRKNNEKIIALNEAVPTKGGNAEAYDAQIGSTKTGNCEEFTMCQYMGDQALELIGLQLLMDWNREGELAKKSPVLNKDVCRVGISNKPHPKTKNLI